MLNIPNLRLSLTPGETHFFKFEQGLLEHEDTIHLAEAFRRAEKLSIRQHRELEQKIEQSKLVLRESWRRFEAFKEALIHLELENDSETRQSR